MPCTFARPLTRRGPRAPNFARGATAAAALIVLQAAHAGGEQSIERIVVTGNASVDLVGEADAASVGTVTQRQLQARTVYRPGELLESVPGLIVSQHSGEGKANQFYLRGFNLDHGTDLRTTVDGMLVNQRTHAHGQGWTDLNFVIPELATGLEYRKGPYFASEGDFASAGAVSMRYANTLDRAIASIGLGENGYRRGLVAGSTPVGPGNVLYALETLHNDGPFVHPDDYGKVNAVLRYSQGDASRGFHVAAMGYQADWNATDQIPLRGLAEGVIGSRWDALDPSDGGKAHRYSLSAGWHRVTEAGATRVNAYVIDWRLDLFSNFTYFLDDPVNGDQFTQPDRRTTGVLEASHTWFVPWAGHESESTVGVQAQSDHIRNALRSTRARETLSTTREDRVREDSVGVYAENATRWLPWLRTVAGVRVDSYRFDVRSDNALNSGRRSASIVSPKLSLVFGPWTKTELYLNAGRGFHSNDARGATLRVDPKTGDAAGAVPPLVRSTGYESGVRTSVVPGLQTSLSVYRLDFDSELVFAGDAGTTEAGRPSRRVGFELANYYRLGDWLTVDADLAYARARFTGPDPQRIGDRVPGAVEGVASLALAVDHVGPWFGAVQWRYFGPRALIEDDSVRSGSTWQVNARAGYRFSPRWRVELEAFNLTDRQASAIDYYYTSRLPGEAAQGRDDVHFHPIEPRTWRISLVAGF